jgi:hypothetical protein
MGGGSSSGAAKYNGTVTVIYDTDLTTYEQYIYYTGLYPGSSAVPSTLTDGKTFAGLYTYYLGYPGIFQNNAIVITGFSSDPGASYLSSIKIGSNTYSLSGAAYGYAGGQAEWDTSTGPWFTAAGSYSVILT